MFSFFDHLSDNQWYSDKISLQEEESRYVLEVDDLPGMDSLECKWDKPYLCLSGMRGSKKFTRDYWVSEVVLSEIDPGGITCEYKRGIVTISLPRRAKQLSPSIPVKFFD